MSVIWRRHAHFFCEFWWFFKSWIQPLSHTDFWSQKFNYRFDCVLQLRSIGNTFLIQLQFSENICSEVYSQVNVGIVIFYTEIVTGKVESGKNPRFKFLSQIHRNQDITSTFTWNLGNFFCPNIHFWWWTDLLS